MTYMTYNFQLMSKELMKKGDENEGSSETLC